MEPFQLGRAIDERHPPLGASQGGCPKERRRYGHNQGLPSGSQGLRCVRMARRLPTEAGWGRKALALTGFEPYEGKLSRTVLRGAWAG